jgi:hypothetical protein
MPYDVEAIRRKIKQAMSGKFSDPDEFRPEKAQPNQPPICYQFFILPPFGLGEQIKGGKAKQGMDQFYVTHGNHWFGDKPHACPRVWDDTECPICKFGFDLLKDEKISKDDQKRRRVIETWMPNQCYMMNIFFPAVKKNPEDLHNRVMFYNAPKTILDICTATLMRDDAGDPESPEAFGVFFDENNAFLFELQVTKQGKNNSYKSSKFLATPRPMIRNTDGSPNETAIAKLLESRHDLFAKIEVPSMEKIKKVFQVMSNGDDSHMDGKSGGFDEDETATATKSSAPAGKWDDGTGQTQTSKAGTTTKKAAPLVEDDEPVKPAKAATTAKKPAADDLADEAPLEEKPALVTAGKKEAANPDIDNLLSQLEDDDE